MSSSISKIADNALTAVSFGVIPSLLGDDDSSADDTDYEAEAQQDAQDDATNAARTASVKKKATTSTVLTSPLGSSSTASTAVTKLGGM